MLLYVTPHSSHPFLGWNSGEALAQRRRELLKVIQDKKAELQKKQAMMLFLVWRLPDSAVIGLVQNGTQNILEMMELQTLTFHIPTF